MDEKPLVTIIIPFLNAEKFFEEAVESVLAQTYTEWELILVDDGSTDKSTHIALEYRNKYPDKINYLQHDQHMNRGISASRNLGIKHAKGKYLAMLDADDRWVENKLEQQVEIMEAYPEASMVYGATEYWFSWTKSPEDAGKDFIIDLNVGRNTLISPPRMLILALESKTITASMSNAMFRLGVVNAHGGFEECFTGMHEDLAFLAKLYLNTPVFIADTCWDMYRHHKDSCYNIAVENKQETIAELKYLDWLSGYLSRNNVSDTQILKALETRKWKYRNPRLSGIADEYMIFATKIKICLKPIIKRYIPPAIVSRARRILHRDISRPPVGLVDFGDLRRIHPISESWGEDRGLPIDRYYIEKFINANSLYIQGRVLEIGDDRYTRKYGNNRVVQSDILNLAKGANLKTTIVADLTSAPQIPSNTFDCIICTQTLMLIYDLRSAIQTLYRILKPGGILLTTVAGIISKSTDAEPWDRNWCWGFTSLSLGKLFKEYFPNENVAVQGFGNLLPATGYLYGLSKEDLDQDDMDYYDHNFELLVAVRCIKPNQY